MSGLVEIFKKVKEAGGQATLTATTNEGKTKIKLEIVSPSATAPPPMTSPAPGRGRRRRKGAAAKVKANARAALHRATRAAATQPPPVSGDASVALEAPAPHQQHHPPLRHPPHLLLSPSPSSGRRRVMSLGRLPRWPTLSFGSLNLDGPPPSPPFSPPTPPPLPPPPAPRTALRVRNVSLEHFGGGDEGLANLAEQVVQHVYRNRWLSLSRSVFSSSASSPSSSGSDSDCSDCSDGSEGCWETDSDVG